MIALKLPEVKECMSKLLLFGHLRLIFIHRRRNCHL